MKYLQSIIERETLIWSIHARYADKKFEGHSWQIWSILRSSKI